MRVWMRARSCVCACVRLILTALDKGRVPRPGVRHDKVGHALDVLPLFPRKAHLHEWTVPNLDSKSRKWIGVIGNGRSAVKAQLMWRASQVPAGELDLHLQGCCLLATSSEHRPDDGLAGIPAFRSARAATNAGGVVVVPDITLNILPALGFPSAESGLEDHESKGKILILGLASFKARLD